MACAVLVYAGMPTTHNYLSNVLPAWSVSFIESMSLRTHFESILKGVLEFKDISYFVILIVGWVSACSIILSERKAS